MSQTFTFAPVTDYTFQTCYMCAEHNPVNFVQIGTQFKYCSTCLKEQQDIQKQRRLDPSLPGQRCNLIVHE